MTEVLIAFAREDLALAKSLAHDLSLAGYAIFWDELTGMEAPSLVNHARIQHARAVIAIWTRASVRSRSFLREVDAARRDDKLIQAYVPGLENEIPTSGDVMSPISDRGRIFGELTALQVYPLGDHKPRHQRRAPLVPSQTAAPVECTWQAGQLQLLLHPIEELDRAASDGRQQNYDHLKSECRRLAGVLQGNNAAPRICTLLEQYAAALASVLQQLDVYRLGHAGIALRAALAGAKDNLSDGNYHELAGLLTSHHMFVAQDEKWTAYVSRAQQAAITSEQATAYAQLGRTLHEQLKQFSPIIDSEIAKALA